MFDRIETIENKTLCGLSMQMSVIEDRTKELWSSFMPKKASIKNRKNSDLISLQLYPKVFDYQNFNPHEEFIKWAAAEIQNGSNIPTEFQSFELKGGQYAIFIHRGTPQEFHKTLRFIYGEWLPVSDFYIDNRPHFELLSDNYRPNDPSATEEVWIPIKKRQG